MVALSFAFIILVISTLTGTSSLQFIKPAMAENDKKLITTADIADNAVTSPKIKDGEVKTSDIEDGTITGDDVSQAFMKRVTLNDDAAGNSHGWKPGTGTGGFIIRDTDISGSINNIQIEAWSFGNDCKTVASIDTVEHFFQLSCGITVPASNAVLHYVITKLPANVVTSSLSASSSPTISSPFSLLGEH